jgi:hypothetical protein
MGVHDASGLHVTRLKRLKGSNLEVSVNRPFKEWVWKFHRNVQIARQLGVLISVAGSASTAFQICHIAVDAKEMIGTHLPKAQIGITTVVNAQTTVDVQYGHLVASRLAILIDRSMEGRYVHEKS